VPVVAVDAAQTLATGDSDELADVGAVELVQPLPAENRVNVQPNRALVTAPGRRALGILDPVEPVGEVLAKGGRQVRDTNPAGGISLDPVELLPNLVKAVPVDRTPLPESDGRVNEGAADPQPVRGAQVDRSLAVNSAASLPCHQNASVSRSPMTIPAPATAPLAVAATGC